MNGSVTRKLVGALLSIGIAQLAGLIGTLLSGDAQRTWYRQIERPAFTPPDWVFAPVWTALYALMGIAAYLVWRRAPADERARPALALYGGQLVLNALWSGAFFGLQSPLAGLVVIGLLWAALMATVARFFAVRTVAGLLLVPYLLWVSFAAVLNFSIWRLNE